MNVKGQNLNLASYTHVLFRIFLVTEWIVRFLIMYEVNFDPKKNYQEKSLIKNFYILRLKFCMFFFAANFCHFSYILLKILKGRKRKFFARVKIYRKIRNFFHMPTCFFSLFKHVFRLFKRCTFDKPVPCLLVILA